MARSPVILDGSFASNAWLQELPHPLTKMTWGNAALLAPETASKLGVESGQVLELRAAGQSLNVPALTVPGHALDCLTLELGYGRDAPAQPMADGVGANGYVLSPRHAPAIIEGVEVSPRHRRVPLAITQDHHQTHERPTVRMTTLAAYRAAPEALTEDARGSPASLHQEPVPSAGLQWAMTIDTTICTGCSACVIACQAENNIPVVGADGVRRAREMHWLRIDTYVLSGEAGTALGVVHQPMACQHCEHAPCEYVCPVFATQHSPDGLNEMVYNRCVGTRFCSNNCPYKVRRFNWFNYTDDAGTLALQRNPDVTVRQRGVMEKCTYCVQRIRHAEVQARMEKRSIAPGEVTTACQQACPTGAIQFGALQHERMPMVQWRREPRSYAVLHELGTRPRTLYLARIRNPAPGGEP